MLWWLAVGLALVALAIPLSLARRRNARTPDLGWMSVQWLQEFRARSSSHY